MTHTNVELRLLAEVMAACGAATATIALAVLGSDEPGELVQACSDLHGAATDWLRFCETGGSDALLDES